MNLHLWHFTGSSEDARRIQDQGLRDHSSGQFGIRWPCFALAGERHWEAEHGPALVEVWIEIGDLMLEDFFTRYCIVGDREIVFYQIVPDLLNHPDVKRLAHDNAPCPAQDSVSVPGPNECLFGDLP